MAGFSTVVVAGALACAMAFGAAGAACAQGAVADHMTPSREYDQERLGSKGMEKCRAYKKVRTHSDEMQSKDHGRLTPGDTRRLMSELSSVKHMAPAKLSAADCGVPL